MKFGEKLRELRKQKHLSQTELGAAVGVSLRTLRGWEVEGRYPKQRELYAKLAEVLKGNELVVTVDLHLGKGESEIYTCDFSNEYVHINADYTT